MMKVSILVPVYGVEKYVGQCSRTLFGQTYDDIEYVFVDDCTPDHSVAVIRQVLAEYPHREQQVRIVRHDHNRGLGAARKTALETATGDFVLNVDSDDYLALDAVEKLVACQQHTDADIVSGNYSSHFEDDTIVFHREQHLDRTTTLKLMLIQHTLLPHIWARLIRKTVYTEHGIESVEGINMAEDMALTPRLIHAANKIAYVEDSVYFYRDDSSASTFANHLSTKHVSSYVKANETLWLYFSLNDKKRDFLSALETGMLNVYYQALAVGIDKRQIADILSYKPQRPFFRCLQGLFAHQQTLPLLRFAYLVVKWCYKKKLIASFG
jgi:glycosyltransferase involved in cell wall biosynthesis